MVAVCPATVALPSVHRTPIRACGLNVYLSEDDVLQEYDNDIGDCSEVSVHAKSKMVETTLVYRIAFDEVLLDEC